MRKLMRALGVLCLTLIVQGALMGWATDAHAEEPPYEDPQFDDKDFDEAIPLIAKRAQKLKGRTELSVSYVSSLNAVTKYIQHQGAVVGVSYALSNTLGVGLDVGFMHGSIKDLVRGTEDPAGPAVGVIDQLVEQCIDGNTEFCGDVTPSYPDMLQVTGLTSLVLNWTPLYGKMNIVSEADLNLQWRLFAGGGYNGTRAIQAFTSNTPANVTDYELVNDGLGEGGFFDNGKLHITYGTGIRLFLSPKTVLEGNLRMLTFWDEFVLNPDIGLESYASTQFFTGIGLGFQLN